MPASEPLLMNNVWLTCGEDREKAQTVLKVTTGHNFIKVIKKKDLTQLFIRLSDKEKKDDAFTHLTHSACSRTVT